MSINSTKQKPTINKEEIVTKQEDIAPAHNLAMDAQTIDQHKAETEIHKFDIARFISINIDSAKYLTLKHKKDSFVLYELELCVNTKQKTSWSLYLKYSEIDAFHRKMEYWYNRARKSQVSLPKMPTMPPKKPWRLNKFDTRFITERIRLFNVYFIELMKYISYSTRKSQHLFIEFFNIDALYKYVMNKDIEMLSELHKYDHNLLLKTDANKSNLLHFMVSSQNIKLIEPIQRLNTSLIGNLLHKTDQYHWNPLTLAKHLKNEEIYKTLLSFDEGKEEEVIDIKEQRLPAQYKHNLCGYQRKLLIIINPASGKGNAMHIWTHCVQPFLDYHVKCIEYVVLVTNRQYHAQEVCKSLSADHEYDGILVFGGDGTIAEVVNGLYYNEDIKNNMPSMITVACGSGNALAKEMGMDDVLEVLRKVVGGFETCIDAYIASQIGESDTYAFVSSQWASISTMDLESENMRWLGSMRFTIKALSEIAYAPKYKARIYFKPKNNDILQEFDDEKERKGNNANDWWKALEVIDFEGDNVDANVKGEYPSDWVCIEGEYELLIVTNLQWIATDNMMGGKDFNAQSNALRLVYNEKGGRYNQTFAFIAMETGTHLDLEYVNHYDVTELVIEPLCKGPPMDVDGEPKPLKPLYVKSLPSHLVVAC